MADEHAQRAAGVPPRVVVSVAVGVDRDAALIRAVRRGARVAVWVGEDGFVEVYGDLRGDRYRTRALGWRGAPDVVMGPGRGNRREVGDAD